MGDEGDSFLRRALRNAGRQVAEARREYEVAKRQHRFDLPTDDEGRAKLVCRRYAEKRTVAVDAEGRPECFDGEHPDCQGCAEDVRAGRVQTW